MTQSWYSFKKNLVEILTPKSYLIQRQELKSYDNHYKLWKLSCIIYLYNVRVYKKINQ